MRTFSADRRFGVNIGSSYANVVLMALITLLVVPLYVATLGASEWGKVALCMTLQGVLFSVDVALAPLMLRDVARAARRGAGYGTYLHFLRIYGGLALALFLIAQISGPGLQMLPAQWAMPDASGLEWPLRIVLTQFLFQFSNNAAIGYWNGHEQQGYANVRLAIFLLAKHGLAVLLVTQWSATATMYLAPFAVIGGLEFFLNARRIRLEEQRRINLSERADVNAKNVSHTPQAATGLSGFAGFGLAAGIGVLTTQVDRLFLSLTLPAGQYGLYFLISTLPLSLLQLQVPIHRAFLPRMATSDSPHSVAVAMLKVSLALLVIPCSIMALFSEWVLRLWLHDPEVALLGASPLRLMLIAIALIALYAPTSTLLLSEQRYRTLIAVNGAVLLVQMSVLFALTPSLGMTAGALAWLGCGFVQVLFTAGLWRTSHVRRRVAAGMRQ